MRYIREYLKNYRYLLFIIFSFVNEGCMDYRDSRDLSIKNGTDKTIYSIDSPSDSIIDSYSFETVEKSRRIKKEIIEKNIIFPGSIVKVQWRPLDWKALIEESNNKHFRMFIITKDSVDKYGWEKILDKNIYTKKYMFNMDSLDNRKWTIVYTEDIKN